MRLLIVEDEAKVAALVARGLRAEGFAVDLADNGRTGWEMVQVHPYDLVILDLKLPQLSGTELLRRLRQRNSEIPVIILTAKDAMLDKITHFEAGADDYLTKPFAFTELMLRTKALLRRGPVSRASLLRVGDLELDRLTHQVRRAGQRVELTAREYSLLEYLMTHSGRVLSRTMIIEHVWDDSFEGLERIVDVYVLRLRTKVDGASSRKLLHTVRSFGYCISEDEEA